MRAWGNRSYEVYLQLDPRLQRVMHRVLHEVADVSLIEGYRDAVRQNMLYADGKSKLIFPHSRHNTLPSKAVDFQPYPLPERKEKLWASLAYIAGRAIQIGIEEGVELRWGGDWNQNGDLCDNTFDDLFHLEIKETPLNETSTVPNPAPVLGRLPR